MRGRGVLCGDLARAAAEAAGLEPGSVGATAVERFVERSVRDGASLDALRERLRARDPRLFEELLSAVLVGETFFFREPAHFELVEGAIRARPAGARRGVHAWSAGCASGEEAYSLAATLLAVAAEGETVGVLGTDLSSRALVRARAGAYGRWSRREAGPMLYPLGNAAGDTLRVRDELRCAVRFERHNLLDPPPRPPGGFDVVMCRNVFVYLHAEAARVVARHLRDALAPGGLLIVGNLGSIDERALALLPVGARELGAYVREPVVGEGSRSRPVTTPPAVPAVPAAVPPTRPSPRKLAAPSPAPPTTTPTPPGGFRVVLPAGDEPADHVAVHLQAIHLIEARRLAEAEVVLGALVGRASYPPALLELALISEQRGRPARAAELATRLLELLRHRDPDEDVAGPEVLPVRYYTTTAEAFLARVGGGDRL